jgi:hypothetical protein
MAKSSPTERRSPVDELEAAVLVLDLETGRDCPVCGNTFMPKGVDQKYCRPYCKKQYKMAKSNANRTARGELPYLGMEKCRGCERPFPKCRENQVHCSAPCRARRKRREGLREFLESKGVAWIENHVKEVKPDGV